ncbi:branched-chain amino acid ABC transporter permease [Agrobacterium sp. NPDC058088]|uniref:branched-chain amino acid ABC transporter permease n=1 Tax=Agrobacterium sp. NPDC058088 TaxID=3346335 RepID=UPI0036D87F82
MTDLAGAAAAAARHRGRFSIWIERHPVRTSVFAILVLLFLFAVFAPWSPGLESVFGRKRIFVSAIMNGLTLGALYFVVASGFTLIFGLMQNVNLAHGSLYALGGYIGYEVATASGSWALSFIVSFLAIAFAGVLLQFLVFRRMEGEVLRQTMVTIGISIVAGDAMLWIWGGGFYQIEAPRWLSGATQLPIVIAMKSDGSAVYLGYPLIRVAVLLASIVLGVAIWLVLNRSRIGMLVRAGVDDRQMLAATGVRVQLLFVSVFAFGAGLAGLAGVIGGTVQALGPGEDIRFLLASLVVVIVGGMGSITGAALGALIVGLAEQLGSVYIPTYAAMITFLIMVVVLAIRPQGIMGRA